MVSIAGTEPDPTDNERRIASGFAFHYPRAQASVPAVNNMHNVYKMPCDANQTKLLSAAGVVFVNMLRSVKVWTRAHFYW